MGIKALLNNLDVIASIDAYIIKADKSLEDEYKDNDVVSPTEAVKFTNELADAVTEIEDNYVNEVISRITNGDNYDLKQGFSVKGILEQKMYDTLLQQIGEDSLETQYADIFHDMFTEYFTETLIQNSERIDNEIVITDYSKRTKDWLADWAHQLAEILNTNDKEAVVKILDSCKDDSKTIEDTADLIAELGVREKGNSARNLAKTETYRINNYAEQEAMLQNPSVSGKMWDHKGPKENARKYHLALDGVTIPADKPFELKGIKGGTYYPMAPHDTCLPVEEVVNCGCRVRAKTSKEVLGKPLKEKAKLQQKRIREADDAWEKEFNEKNKKASDVDFEKVKLNWLQKKTPEEQIKYFGGGHSGKARKALIDSGVITTDEQLNKLYKRNTEGKRQLKTLKELENDGIITVREKALKHSYTGTYKPKSKEYPNGRLFTGGHSAESLKECNKKGIKCSVLGEYTNGVKFGNVSTAKLKENKNMGGHTWFPENWNSEQILNAGTAVANKPMIDNEYEKIGIYNGVAVRVLMTDNIIDSIHPIKDQIKYIKEVDLL
ncbi:MAG: EndoU domain-containing protein [Clostridia bacterium]|nr:EndoU domain-containing protein [Clostridia bacterium]